MKFIPTKFGWAVQDFSSPDHAAKNAAQKVGVQNVDVFGSVRSSYLSQSESKTQEVANNVSDKMVIAQ